MPPNRDPIDILVNAISCVNRTCPNCKERKTTCHGTKGIPTRRAMNLMESAKDILEAEQNFAYAVLAVHESEG